jgi:hypothetical protein
MLKPFFPYFIFEYYQNYMEKKGKSAESPWHQSYNRTFLQLKLEREYSVFENRNFQFVKSSIAIFVKTKTEERIQKTLFSSSPAQLKRIKASTFQECCNETQWPSKNNRKSRTG